MSNSIDDLVPSKSNFLKKEDVSEAGKNLTIASFANMEVGMDGSKETKFCIVWQQQDYKPMIVNRENANRLKVIFKTDDVTKMVGKTICVYSDPMVGFGGKIVGGLRLRPAATTAQRSKAAPAPAAEDPNDDLPPADSYEEDSSVPF